MTAPDSLSKNGSVNPSAPAATFVGRQAIYNRSLAVYAYELLYRSGHTATAGVTNDVQATAEVLTTALVDIGLDKLTKRKKVFINVDHDYLVDIQALPISPEFVVLEILEDVSVDQRLVDRVKSLAREGFTFALDDYVGGEQWKILLPHVSIIKVDIRELDDQGLENIVKDLKPFRVTLLAEKVETEEEFNKLAALGFDLFQGYFLSRPAVIEGQRLSSAKQSLLQLLAAVQDPETRTGELVSLIERDVGLSLKLLRLLNSARFHGISEVTSIERSVALLGLNGLRQWASLLCLSNTDTISPELMRLSLVRAKLCELIMNEVKPVSRQASFTVGLFSGIEAILRTPLTEVLADLPLAQDIKQALLEESGPLSEALDSAYACERFEWDCAGAYGLEQSQIAQFYAQANRWGDSVLAELDSG